MSNPKVYVVQSKGMPSWVQAVRLDRDAAERYADSCPFECEVKEFHTDDIDHWENWARLESRYYGNPD